MKTLRYTHGGRKACAFTNGFIVYGRSLNGKYRIEADYGFGYTKDYIRFYQGDKKPFFRNIWVLSITLAPFAVVAYIILYSLGCVIAYINGSVNFFKGSMDQTDVRFFNWVNMVLMIILSALHIINYLI